MSPDQSNPLFSSDRSVPPEPSSLDQKLAVDTPEQIRLEFLVAGIGSRFLAIAIDSLIQIGVAIALALVLIAVGYSFSRLIINSGQSAIWLGALAIILAFLLNYGYFIFFEIWWGGQTPGKRAVGICVIKESGRPLNAVEVIGRNLMRIVDWLPFFYAIGVLSAILNGNSKRLGDFVAGSIVVRTKRMPTTLPFWEEDVPYTPSTALLGARHLSPEDHRLLETYLSRRNDLNGVVRYRVAVDIMNRLEPKLQLTDMDRMDPERTLGKLGDEWREGIQ